MHRRVQGVCLLLLCLTAACATRGAVRQVRLDVLRVEARLDEIGAEVSQIDSLARAESVASRHKWSGMAADGEGNAQRLQQMVARMDDVVRRLADVRQEVEAIRIYGVGKGGGAGASPPGRGGANAAASPSLVADPQALYDLGSGDLKAKDYAQAATEFGQFVESFPQHELADNALYWQGEAHYALKDYVQAQAAFERLLKDYPTGDKAPAAALKLGFALLEQKDKKAGTARLKEVVQNYPGTEEAGLAKARLRDLNSAPSGRRR